MQIASVLAIKSRPILSEDIYVAIGSLLGI